MRSVRILALLVPCLTAGSAAAQQPHQYAETLHKQAVELMKQRFISPLKPRFVKQLGDPIKERLDQGRDISMMIGPTLTRSGKGLYFATWGDKIFTFDLTPKQNEMAGLRGGTFQLRDLAPEPETDRTPDMVKLSKLSLDGGTRHKMNEELAGTVKFTVKEKLEGHLVLRVSCLSENNRATQYHRLPDGLPAGEEITFRLKPLKEVNRRLLPHPAILFVDLCTTADAKSTDDLTVRSNAVAILHDLVE